MKGSSICMAQNGIVVIGSANMDLVARSPRFPLPGETMFGEQFAMFPGGKGANQAVASAKLGGNVHFVGKMGNDLFRDNLSSSMRHDGVRLNHLMVDNTTPTGVAIITVSKTGENEIIVISGSNMKLMPADLEKHRAVFGSASVTLLQLEIPLPTVAAAVRLAKQHGHQVILNPAPARKLPKSILQQIDILTPNKIEIQLLAGMAVEDQKSAECAARKLLSMGVRNVIITLGRRGSLLVNAGTTELFPSYSVKAVDTTAAGDAFNGGLAFALAQQQSLEQAIRFASGVAAYSVTKLGAQCSMPTSRELKRFLLRRNGI